MNSIVLGKIYFDGNGVESDWSADILGIHTGNTDKGSFMDLYTPNEPIRYYPNDSNDLGRFFTVDWIDYKPNILEMHPDKNEIFNVKKIDLFGGRYDPINELRKAKEAAEPTKEWYKSAYDEVSKQLNDRNLIIEVLLKELRNYMSGGVDCNEN